MKIKKFGATEQLVYELAKPIAEENGVDIWDVRFEKEGASWYLRVFIDKEDGINIDDCEAVTRPLSDILDEKDPISQGYFLEVGSAGIERELLRESHFRACTGSVVHVKMIRPLEGIKEFTAELSGFTKDSVTLSFPVNSAGDGGNVREIPLADIANIRLYDDFNEFL
ncbi:ribosome maturation factor RimP [Porcipelethomonas sp.]|uniref:ribosome maturation factor RimP n=1 Tax=Porcipelethomonas sp. TaxID=2981675 RepID=UPI003EF7746E